MLSFVLCFVALFAAANARSGGAPDQGTVCTALMPGGPHVADSIVEQNTTNPWTVDICGFDEVMGFYQYTPGVTYNITLQPAQGAALTLRGFLIQGRTQLGNAMVGTFLDPSGISALTQLSLCTPRSIGVTHNNPAPGTLDIDVPLTFQWTAPAAGTGPIWFRYTIMENRTMWWADDSSAIVQEAGNLVFPNGAPQLQGVGFWTLLVSAAAVALKTVL